MKTLRQLFATILLALMLGITTYAGDMNGPPGSNSPDPWPTDNVPTVTKPAPPIVPGDEDSPILTIFALNFLMGALSIY